MPQPNPTSDSTYGVQYVDPLLRVEKNLENSKNVSDVINPVQKQQLSHHPGTPSIGVSIIKTPEVAPTEKEKEHLFTFPSGEPNEPEVITFWVDDPTDVDPDYLTYQYGQPKTNPAPLMANLPHN